MVQVNVPAMSEYGGRSGSARVHMGSMALWQVALIGYVRHDLDGFHLPVHYGLYCALEILKGLEALARQQALELPPLDLYGVELGRVRRQEDKHYVAAGRLDEPVDLLGPVAGGVVPHIDKPGVYLLQHLQKIHEGIRVQSIDHLYVVALPA